MLKLHRNSTDPIHKRSSTEFCRSRARAWSNGNSDEAGARIKMPRIQLNFTSSFSFGSALKLIHVNVVENAESNRHEQCPINWELSFAPLIFSPLGERLLRRKSFAAAMKKSPGLIDHHHITFFANYSKRKLHNAHCQPIKPCAFMCSLRAPNAIEFRKRRSDFCGEIRVERREPREIRSTQRVLKRPFNW